jgi:hypothetical protein
MAGTTAAPGTGSVADFLAGPVRPACLRGIGVGSLGTPHPAVSTLLDKAERDRGS